MGFIKQVVKIRNINIGYNLPDKVAKKLKMESIRVFASIQQPLILSEYRQKYKGIDPETSTHLTKSPTLNSILPPKPI